MQNFTPLAPKLRAEIEVMETHTRADDNFCLVNPLYMCKIQLLNQSIFLTHLFTSLARGDGI